jgi:hypothetical protein
MGYLLSYQRPTSQPGALFNDMGQGGHGRQHRRSQGPPGSLLGTVGVALTVLG